MLARLRTWSVFAGLMGLAVALVPSGAARLVPTRVASSAAATLVFGAEQGGGPDWCLNQHLDIDCAAGWNVVFETPVIRGAFLLRPDFVYQPDLIGRYVLKTNPLRITYFIRKNATWSDGVPVTAKDFRFTWQEKLDPRYHGHTDRTGWEDIARVAGNGKVVRVTFKRNFAAWKDLFGFVLPAHALVGSDLSTVWESETGIVNPRTGRPIGDGPFVMTKFDRGCCITLVRNPHAWHGKRAKLGAIVFRFITDTNSEIAAMRAGEVDAIYPQPQLALADVKGLAGLRIQSHLGLQFEHVEIEEGAKGNPLAKVRWGRQALITSLDRYAAAKALFGTLNPKIKVLNSLTRLTNEPGYKPYFKKWNYNPSKVASIMRQHNCVRGTDGFFRCAGTKMAFDFASTAGNKLRELAFVIFQNQAEKAGIQLRDAFVPAGTLFGSEVPEHNFDLAMFSYLVTVDPHYDVSVFS
jgi:peptide/nickel transport system substrate-binding protein